MRPGSRAVRAPGKSIASTALPTLGREDGDCTWQRKHDRPIDLEEVVDKASERRAISLRLFVIEASSRHTGRPSAYRLRQSAPRSDTRSGADRYACRFTLRQVQALTALETQLRELRSGMGLLIQQVLAQSCAHSVRKEAVECRRIGFAVERPGCHFSTGM